MKSLRRNIQKIKGLDGKKLNFALVVSRFNSRITERLLDGAVWGLRECEVENKNIRIVEVPGAFEIPQVALLIAKHQKVDAIICLGAVIRGGTPHFEYISAETARGIMEAGLLCGIPFIFGVLTVNNLRQAIERSSGKNNKGRESAFVAVEMALLFKKIQKKKLR